MHTGEDFKRLAKKTTNGQLRTRYLALYHFKNGQSRTQIAKYLGVARGSVNTWVTNYLSHGIKGLEDKPKPGRPNLLTPFQQAALKQYIEHHSIKEGGGRLIGEDIQHYIHQKFGVDYKLRNIYRLLHALGFSWITSHSKHPKQSLAIQDEFKKNRD